jgi:hypothetical protein
MRLMWLAPANYGQHGATQGLARPTPVSPFNQLRHQPVSMKDNKTIDAVIKLLDARRRASSSGRPARLVGLCGPPGGLLEGTLQMGFGRFSMRSFPCCRGAHHTGRRDHAGMQPQRLACLFLSH